MPRSFTFATITEYQAAKGNSGAIYAELVSSGIKSGSCVSKITATGDVFIDSINPFVTPDLGQEGDTLYYNSSDDSYRFLRAGNTTWDADSLGQVFIDLSKIPSGFSKVDPFVDEFVYKRTTENIGSGKASMTKILGNTVAWNQRAKNEDLLNGITAANANKTMVNGILHWEATGGNTYHTIYVGSLPTVEGHKYYACFNLKCAVSGSPSLNIGFYGKLSGTALPITRNGNYKEYGAIVSATETANSSSYFGMYAICPSDGFTIDCSYALYVDLTLLFGAERANTITIDEFRALFPYGKYSRNPGQLLSNKAKAIEFVGFNLWDEEWEVGGYTDNGTKDGAINKFRCKNLIPVLPDIEYYIKGDYIQRVCMYDANKEFIGLASVSSKKFTTDSTCKYITFNLSSAGGTTYNHDICINLSGKRNGQYEPYKKVVLPLPNLDQIKVYSHNLYDPVTGKAKVEGGKQYYIGGTYTSISQNGTAITVSSHLFTPSESGDVDVVGGNSTDTIINLSSSFNGQYEPHGILTMEGGLKSAYPWYDEYGPRLIQRCVEVDMGDLDYSYSNGRFYISSTLPNVRTLVSGTPLGSGLLCSKYASSKATGYTSVNDKEILSSVGGVIQIWDSAYTDPATFKAALKAESVKLIYALATPIEYEIYNPTKMPFNWKYRVSEYHTKKMLPENGENPTSAPFACEIKQI